MSARFKRTEPVWCVAFAFVVTIVFARWVSYVRPAFHYNIDGIHIHHYTYGIFILTVAGYFALVLKGPRATFWVALLYGWGAGFTFDEMGMWLNSSIDQNARWDRTGVIVGVVVLVLSVLLSLALKMFPPASHPEPTVVTEDIKKDDSPFRPATMETLAAQEEE